jgi:hypothetical protein
MCAKDIVDGRACQSLKNYFCAFSNKIFMKAILRYSNKCLKFKVPKMPKIKDANHFMKDKIPITNNK